MHTTEVLISAAASIPHSQSRRAQSATRPYRTMFGLLCVRLCTCRIHCAVFRDVADDKSSSGDSRGMAVRRRRKRSVFHLRNILLFLAVATCLATMLWFMTRAGTTV